MSIVYSKTENHTTVKLRGEITDITSNGTAVLRSEVKVTATGKDRAAYHVSHLQPHFLIVVFGTDITTIDIIIVFKP